MNYIAESSSLSAKAQAGKTLFMSKCASCHSLKQSIVGPALAGFEERGPWADRKKLYEWIRDPVAFMKKDSYTQGLQKQYRSLMTGFPNLADEEIDAICEFINAK